MVTLRDAKEVSNEVVKLLHPISVIVFGSVAKEGAGEDLDLLIVSDDERGVKGLNSLLSKHLKGFYKRFAIDPFIVPVSRLRECFFRGSPFLRLIQNEGRALYMKDSVKQWLRQVQDDLKMAEYLLDGGYFRGACYHSQQSIEKALKAGLLQRGWELERIHSIERLMVLASEYRMGLEVDEEDIIFIDSIYRGRYPVEEGLLPLGEPDKEDAIRAVSIARKIVKEMKRFLKE